MPHTSIVIILLTAFVILSNINLYGVTIEPKVINLYTFTNLTISGAVNVTVAPNTAVVDFIIKSGDVFHIGLRPLQNPVRLIVDNRTIQLPVVPICVINLYPINETARIDVNVTSNCPDVRLYANNTLIRSTPYAPRYAGIYEIVATNGKFYNKTLAAVRPTLRISGNVFGDMMRLVFDPPPPSGTVRLGGYSFPARSELVIDTWDLGGGNYTLTLSIGNYVAGYNVTIQRAVPRVEIRHRAAYTYGERIAVTVNVYVGNRPYKASVALSVNGTVMAALTPAVIDLGRLDAGSYTVQAVVAADRNITSASSASVFRVNPAPVSLTVSINGTTSSSYVVEYGKIISVQITASSLAQPVGLFQLFLDGAPVGTTIDTLALPPGSHNLTALFRPATRNFLGARASVLLVVVPSQPRIAVNRTFSTVFGTPVTIPFYVSLHGRPIDAVAHVDITGRNYYANYTIMVRKGVGVLAISLPAGTYLGTITVGGQGGLQLAQATFNVFVSSAPVVVALDVATRGTYGELIPVRVKVEPKIGGKLTVTVNNTIIYDGNNTEFQGWWAPPRSGVFEITALFKSADPNYADTANATYIYIDRARCVIEFDIKGSPIYVLRRYEIEVKTDLNFDILINGKKAGTSVIFNSTGVYNVTVYFKGDDRYYPCAASRIYMVVKNPANITISTVRRVSTVDRKLPLYIRVESPIGGGRGEVLIYKRNKTLNFTSVKRYSIDGNTTVELAFDSAGVYEISAEFTGNQYLEPAVSNNLVVTIEAGVFGIPMFLMAIYLTSLASGVALAYFVRRILKRSA